MESPSVPLKVQGYLYLIVENITCKDSSKSIGCHISLGAIAKCQTTVKKSGTIWNEVFMIEVPQEPSRLVMEFKEGQTMVGDCRYDVNPFFVHPGSSHPIQSDFIDDKNKVQGSVNIKITYYSAEYGKIELRIFHMNLVEAFVEKFKHAKIKARIGVYAQSTASQQLGKQFDYTLDLLVLSKNANLSLEVVHEEGVLATYTIYDLQKSNLLIDQTKAYQVSLFNNDKAVGTIKYQVTWVKDSKL